MTPHVLERDPSVPLPLGCHRAVCRAYILREACPQLSYANLAYLMDAYHGVRRRPSWWRKHLAEMGADKRPRGVPFQSQFRREA